MGWAQLHAGGQGSPLVCSLWAPVGQPCSTERGEKRFGGAHGKSTGHSLSLRVFAPKGKAFLWEK